MEVTINIKMIQQFIFSTYFFYNLFGMEIKNQKSEKGSEISYLKLENSREVQTPEQGSFILKQAFLKHLLQMNASKINGSDKQSEEGSFNYESDDGFLSQLFQIVEKHEPSLQDIQQRQPLDDKTCQYIHQLCLRHRQANKFNEYSDFDAHKVPAQKKCLCGCGKAQGQPLSLCTDQLQHYFFGPTILVFFFMRKMVILLVIIAVTYGLYAVITNLVSAPQLGSKCTSNAGMLSFLCPMKYQLTTINKLQNQYFMKIQVWLGFILCLIWIISIRIIRSMGRILNKKIDSFLDSSSDYVIQISNLPYAKYTETQLLKYIVSLWKNMKGKNCKIPAIKSVLIVYQMDESRKMIKNIINNSKNLFNHLVRREKDGKTLYQIKQGHLQIYLKDKMELIQSMVKIEEYRQKFINNAEFRKQFATDIAFIQFCDANDQAELLKQTKQYRITILGEIKEYIMSQIFSNQEDTFIFKGNSIRITRAPEPSDINWLNCQKKNSYKRIAFVWLIALFIVCVSFGFLTLIRFLRSTFTVLQSLSILMSISLQTFNRIIWNTMLSTVSLQQNNTSTDNVISIMSKGAFAQAVNVLVLPLIFNYVMRKNIYGPQGLIGSVFDYHFTFLFMQIFLNLINVPYQLKRISIHIKCIRNWIIRNYSHIVGEVDTAEQIKQVISYYETPSFSIASVYTSLNTIIFHTVFYIHIQPALIFTLIFNIVGVYFIQKYLLLRRYKIPELVDFIIFQNCCSYLQHVPAIYAAGSMTFIFLTQATNENFNWKYLPCILCIGLWIICVMNPFSALNKVTKCLVSKLGYNQNQVNIKETGVSEQKMAEDIANSESQQNKIFKRKQSYYSGCGTNQLLQYEAKLTQIKKTDEYQNQNKLFCQRFFIKSNDILSTMTSSYNKNTTAKKSSRKILPKMKESFMVLKQSVNKSQNKKSNNNKIIPIDVCKFNENINMRSSFGFEQDKQNDYVKRPKKSTEREKEQQKTKRDQQKPQKQEDETKNRLVINKLQKQSVDL